MDARFEIETEAADGTDSGGACLDHGVQYLLHADCAAAPVQFVTVRNDTFEPPYEVTTGKRRAIGGELQMDMGVNKSGKQYRADTCINIVGVWVAVAHHFHRSYRFNALLKRHGTVMNDFERFVHAHHIICTDNSHNGNPSEQIGYNIMTFIDLKGRE